MFPEKSTKDGILRVKCAGNAEQNNGRQLWKVLIFFKNIDITNEVDSWNYVNYRVDRWVLESNSGDFAYLPIEGQSKLINLRTQEIISITTKGLSTISFVGNFYTKNSLVEIYSDEVIITNLQNFEKRIFPAKEGGMIAWVKIDKRGDISLIYYDDYSHLSLLKKLRKIYELFRWNSRYGK